MFDSLKEHVPDALSTGFSQLTKLSFTSLIKPLRLTVTRRKGRFELDVAKASCSPEPETVTGFEFTGAPIPPMEPLKVASTRHTTVKDEELRFESPAASGSVTAMGNTGPLSDTIPFQHFNSLEIQAARVEGRDLKHLSVTVQAKGQLVDATSVTVNLQGNGPIAVDFSRCRDKLSLTESRSFVIEKTAFTHDLSGPEVSHITLGARFQPDPLNYSSVKPIALDRVPAQSGRSERDFVDHLVVPLFFSMLATVIVLIVSRAVTLRFFDEIVTVAGLGVGAIVAILQEATELGKTAEHFLADKGALLAPASVLMPGLVFGIAAWKGLFSGNTPRSVRRHRFQWVALGVLRPRRFPIHKSAAVIIALLTVMLLSITLNFRSQIGTCAFQSENYLEVLPTDCK